MITNLLDIARNIDFEDYGSSLAVTRVQWAEDNLRLWLHVTDDEGSNVHPYWQVICSGVREDFLLMGYCDGLELTDSHVLLWPHKQLRTSTSFYGTAENPLAVVGALYDKHREMIGDWIPFHRFLNPNVSLKALIAGGYGMLAEGPEQLIVAYEEVMRSYGFSTSHLDPRTPVYWNGTEWIKEESNLHVLLMGQSYVIAEQFTAEAL
ncbi:hypothetical protein C7H19_23720 [Aphanothece hegewaldii CCALA 016]|uniref:Uncharacterized protein n=1 Tax=Aphanothece hegewaldii CCALA 016 TaxID=2107694 RepID=A0A2T1LR05_9CHRO|nr:hypothetical protein [Aphanothece hegewaldii]PSF30524.1 hypothetical protein C7H19_23720 [Aphanothece hegewaldii CCALA 016]